MEAKDDIEKRDSLGHSLPGYDKKAVDDDVVVEILNVSGHVQELDRSLGFWSICAVSIVADNAWAAGAGALVRDILIPSLSLRGSIEGGNLTNRHRLSLYMMAAHQAFYMSCMLYMKVYKCP